MRYQGRITDWKDDKGFGFVTAVGGGERAFVHIKAFSARTKRPQEGDLITYELGQDDKRRFQAQNIRFADTRPPDTRPPDTRPPTARAAQTSFEPFIVGVFGAFLALSMMMDWLPSAVPGAYLVVSFFTFLAYAIDKAAAENKRWRTPESTLHFWALMGGWPGALLAQKSFRHKSKKESFQNIFWVTIIINCVALGWLFTSSGAAVLAGMLRMLGLAA